MSQADMRVNYTVTDAVILAVGYQVFMQWVDAEVAKEEEAGEVAEAPE